MYCNFLYLIFETSKSNLELGDATMTLWNITLKIASLKMLIFFYNKGSSVMLFLKWSDFFCEWVTEYSSHTPLQYQHHVLGQCPAVGPSNYLGFYLSRCNYITWAINAWINNENSNLLELNSSNYTKIGVV